ncbi:MAG: arginine N-succinyltransferase [Nitrospirales bacterium]
MSPSNAEPSPPSFQLGGFKVLGIVVLVVILTIGLTAWWMNKNIYAAPFTPTQLSSSEQHVLEAKMAQLSDKPKQVNDSDKTRSLESASEPLRPEPYTEDESQREIQLSEKELNALIAKNPETAQYVAVDLADDLISVKLLVPIDQDFPILGGKTLKLNLGLVLKYEKNTPVVAIRGMSLGGVPLPQSWWGDIKNVNLVEKFGADGGFWDQFAKGVEHISVHEGQFRVTLQE